MSNVKCHKSFEIPEDLALPQIMYHSYQSV